MHLLYYVIMLQVVLSAKFSGVYRPNIKLSREDFAGSWLVPVQRFIQAKEYLQMHATNIESACFAILNTGSQVSVMTRDYFDFEVIHLSSTTNVLPSGRNELLAELLFRMNQTVNALDASSVKILIKRYKINSASHRWRNQTIAVIAFTELSGSSSQSNFAAEIRRSFFKATFWSVYRRMPHILVATMTDREADVVRSFRLPVWMVVNVMQHLNPANIMKSDGHLLPQKSLLYVMNNIEANVTSSITNIYSAWRNFKYIYYTEGDLILHMRNTRDLYDILDRTKENVALIPHRMQTIALPKTFPEQYRSVWSKKMLDMLKGVKVAVESYVTPQGSCCDSGRFSFADCSSWWYRCEEWGLRNYRYT